MTIRELQDEIAKTLNGIEALVQGGCRAIAEDTQDVVSEVESQLAEAAGVALVVTTPNLTRNGCAAGALPCEARLSVRCIEVVSTNRAEAGHLTALDAAETVAHALDGGRFSFAGISQTADDRRGTITVACDFTTTIHLTK